MEFGLTAEQEMVVATVRGFVESELYPLEAEVERSGEVAREVAREIQRKVLALGFYAPNMPAELGGGGLDPLTFALLERELGRASLALVTYWGRPSNILMACVGEQRDKYLLPAIRGEKIEALAMTEPDAGSDVRSMKTTARRDGGHWVLSGTKHFISHADAADFLIVFAATGEEETAAGRKKRITGFLVDRDAPGLEIRPGYASVSHRGYHNSILVFDECRLAAGQVLGEVHRGFEAMNEWLSGTRLTVAAMCVGRARRALDLALGYAASRKQFGQPIGKFQGVSFKLADMVTEIDAADWLTLAAAWRVGAGLEATREISSAKLYASEMLARVTDAAIQIFGGMGLMADLPLERFWRDARVERIWDGTSEIHRHIIARDMLRKLGGVMARSLERLYRPKAIAAIGGREAAEVVAHCERMGFAGAVWPVHPTREEVHGRRAFRSVAELPGSPDAAFVGVSRHATIEVVRELAARGAGGAICYASGFGEAADGAELQRALVAAAGGMPVLGPNCYGLINYLDGALLWPDQHGGRRVERGVAIVTQSSNMAINMTMQRRGLSIAYVATAGNQAQTGLAEIAESFLEDFRVTAVGLHVEGIKDAARFEKMAFRARELGKPVAAITIGRSGEARAAAISHTASIAGSEAATAAFFARLGVARLRSVPAFLEALKLLHVHGPLPGGELASMSCSGGEAALMADAAVGRGVRFRPLQADEKARVKATLSDLVTVANPLDYHTFVWGKEAAMTETFAAMLGCGFDLSLLVLDFPSADRCTDAAWEAAVGAIGAAAERTGERAAVVATLPENMPESRADAFVATGIAPLCGVEEAIAAAEAAAFIGARWKEPLPAAMLKEIAPTGELVPPLSLATGEEPGFAAAVRVLDEADAKQALAAFGVPVPAGRVVSNAKGAVAAAEEIGYPVALKALGVAHKTEAGALRLGLRDAAEVAAAAEALAGRGAGLLVEAMAPDAVAELLIGVMRDPQFGFLMTVGTGGVLVELLGDTQSLLLPASEADIHAAILSLKTAPLLQGFRGRPPGDVEAAVAAAMAVARFAEANVETLEEVEVNPLLVRATGQGTVAVDALVRIWTP